MRNLIPDCDIYLSSHGRYHLGDALFSHAPLTGVTAKGVEIVEFGTIKEIVRNGRTVWARIEQIITKDTVIINRVLGWIEIAGARFDILIGNRPVLYAAIH